MKEQHYFLGIDLGTSSLKLVLIDSEKRIVCCETIAYGVSQPAFGWREIDPRIWTDSLFNGMERVFSRFPARQLDGIGTSGQMHTLVVLDGNGEPLRPAIMWDDMRTAALLPSLKETIAQYSGTEYIERLISTGSPAANLYWIRKYEPETFARIRKFLIATDYIVHVLTGEYVTDYCGASTSCLYDIQNKCWSESMRSILALPKEIYPDVRASALLAGNLLPHIARRFGMREDVKVIVGTGDNPATAISTGCLGQGVPFISLGTSGVLMSQASQLHEETKGKKILTSLDNRHFQYLVQGALQSNGTAYEWWNRQVLQIDDLSQIDNMVGEDRLPDPQLLFFPHLMGEKTLFSDPNLRGAMLGLSVSTTRYDLIYTVMEGIAYGFRELADRMQLDLTTTSRIRLVGGGSRSSTWMQVMADVLNITVEQTEGENGAGLGIALLAAYHCGFISSVEEMAEGCICVKHAFLPRPEATTICTQKYSYYQRIHHALKMVYA